MVDQSKIRLYRLIHIDNISHIVKYGLTTVDSKFANKEYISIGDQTMISKRKDVLLCDDIKKLNQVIPFYFGVRMPMLFVIQNGFNNVPIQSPTNIVYCVTNVKNIISNNLLFYFTDGHAINKLSTIYNHKEIERINMLLDFEAIHKKYWNDDEDIDLKRRKEAEFLVSEDIPFHIISGWVVYDQRAKTQLIKLGINENRIAIRPEYYFE